MSLKITVRPKEKVENKMSVSDIAPGMVFEYGNGVIGLKLCCFKNVALLKYSSGSDWFKISDGSMDYHGAKILGRLDEIIVVEK